MKVSNDDTFTGKFNLGGITLVDFSRKVPVKLRFPKFLRNFSKNVKKPIKIRIVKC